MLEKFLNNKLQKLGYVKKEDLEEVKEKQESNKQLFLSSIETTNLNFTKFEDKTTKIINEWTDDTSEAIEALANSVSVLKDNLIEVEDRLEDELGNRESVLNDFKAEVDKKTATPSNPVIREIKDEIKTINSKIAVAEEKIEDLRLVPGEYLAIKQMFETYKKKVEKSNADTAAKAEATEEAMRAFDEVYNSMIQRTNKKVGHMNSQTWKEIDAKTKTAAEA